MGVLRHIFVDCINLCVWWLIQKYKFYPENWLHLCRNMMLARIDWVLLTRLYQLIGWWMVKMFLYLDKQQYICFWYRWTGLQSGSLGARDGRQEHPGTGKQQQLRSDQPIINLKSWFSSVWIIILIQRCEISMRFFQRL